MAAGCISTTPGARSPACTFTKNIANSSGSGLYINHSSTTITNCTITENKADKGGGIYSRGKLATITNCTITGNTAAEGGGIYNYLSTTMIEGCTFSANTANRGAGMFNDNSSPMITNCLIARNTADRGAGTYEDNSSPTLSCCTFAENTADKGDGMYSNISSPTLLGCILWNHGDQEIYTIGDSAPVITYSCMRGGYDGEGNIKGDPLFVDASGGNFQLTADSPCIDTGPTEDSPATDILGKLRPQGDGVDMGAYESYINNAADPAWLIEDL